MNRTEECIIRKVVDRVCSDVEMIIEVGVEDSVAFVLDSGSSFLTFSELEYLTANYDGVYKKIVSSPSFDYYRR